MKHYRLSPEALAEMDQIGVMPQDVDPAEAYLQWAKARARWYLKHTDAEQALGGLLSDLRKHPGTRHIDVFQAVQVVLGGGGKELASQVIEAITL